MANRLLPEWHPQDAIQLTWPRADGDWAGSLERIEATLETMIVAIARYQRVLVSVPDDATRSRLAASFHHLRVPTQRLRLLIAPADDTWCRDHGPITVERDGKPLLLDYTFTGWGGKFPAERDNALTQVLAEQGAYRAPTETREMILEGGAIETDGQGTLLATEACLLNPNRNAEHTRTAIEARLRQDLGIERFLWLSHGYLEGDDTDSHIDTLARFCDPHTIAYVKCDDERDPHYPELKAMEEELTSFRQVNGAPYRLVPLPWPSTCRDPEYGHRLPATYANFLIINDAVLVPTYGDAADARALATLAGTFHGRDIVPIECRSVIRQHGSLHCLTMQLPRGTLAPVVEE